MHLKLLRTLRLLLPCLLAAVLCGVAGQGRGAAQGFELGLPVLAVNTPNNHPVFVAAVDVNADGIPDLIYIDEDATATGSTTHVMLGDGKGHFTQSAQIATAGVSLAIGNLLGNNRVDIGWLTSENSNGIRATWHIAGGVGDGTYNTPVVGGDNVALQDGITQLPNFSSLRVANDQGQADTEPSIVAVDSANNQIFAFPIGSGSLVADHTALVKGPGALTVADLNNDTYGDILVDGQTEETVQVYLGAPIVSGAVFGINGGYFSGTAGVQSLALADFNGDGKLDMAAENPSGQIDVFPGNGDGSFEAFSIGSTSSADDTKGDGGTPIVAKDLNYDGILDMLAFSPLGVSVEIGTASGAFLYTGSYSGGPGTGTNGQFATADFNGGGGLDVAMDAPNGIVILYGRTLIAKPEPSLVGEAFTLMADLGPAPPGTVSSYTGTVAFSIAGTPVGTSNVQTDGTATWTIPTGNAYPVGVYPLTATWLATPGAVPVGLSGSHTIVKLIPTTGTLDAGPPTAFEAAIPVSVTIHAIAGRPTPTGTVTFSIAGGYPLPIPSVQKQLSNGTASYTFPLVAPNTNGNPVVPGANTVTAEYGGDLNYAAVSLSGTHTVELGVTTVTLTAAPPTPVLTDTYFYGQPINGYVIITQQDQSATTNAQNQAIPEFPLKGTWEQLSNGVGVPGCIALPIPGGNCPYGYPTLIDAGDYVWVEQYNGGPANGDPVNGSADSIPYQFKVTPDTTTASLLLSSLNPAPLGTAVTFTATLTGNVAVPTGLVQFFDGANLIGVGTLNAAGQASFTTAVLRAGSHSITAVYAATLDFNAAKTLPLPEIVVAVPLPSVVLLGSSLNPSLLGRPVTFTAAASVPGPFAFQVQSGTMTFLDGSTAIGTAPIDQFGRARFTTATLAVGSHPITASYAAGTSPGGQPIAAGVSAVLTQIVQVPIPAAPSGIQLTVTPNPVTLKPGSTGVLLVTVAALSGFDQPIALTCTGPNSSNELGCTFVQPAMPAGGGATTLDLATTAPYPCGGNPTQPYFKQTQASVAPSCGLPSSPTPASAKRNGWRALELGAPMAAGLLWLWPRRRRRFAGLVAVALLAGVMGLSGCGGNCSNLGTRPGGYSITVVATAGAVSQSVVVQVNVLDP